MGLFLTSCNGVPETQLSSKKSEEVIRYANENLPLHGRLIVTEEGFGYLKVDDAYINTLFPMLEISEKGYRKPPYFRSKESPGAHISVFYVDEQIHPQEIGQTFPFTLKRVAIVHASRYAKYAILEVESKELERLRQKYGLSPKLKGHEFHITLAKKTLSRHRRRF